MNRSWIVPRGKNSTSPGSSSPRRRKGIAALAGVALALGVSVVVAPMARAADGPWSIDGTVADAGATLLEPPVEPYGNVKELGPKNASTTKIGVIHNASTPMLEKTNPNAQVDLRRAWIGTKRDGANQDGDVWLYFAWERDANSGSGFIAYEFMHKAAPAACAYTTASEADLIASCNPWKNREAGDFMILWDQSGGSTTLYKRVWATSGGGLVLGPQVPLTASTSQASFSGDKFKGEAAVNLTAEIFDPNSTSCESFANTIPSTVTGNSDTADYKDTILQQAPPISNCGTLIVKKLVINDDGGTKIATNFSFQVNAGTATSFIQDGTDTLKGKNTLTDLKGTFTVTEPAVSGYTTTYQDCSNIAVGAGDTKTCTITNDDQPGTLIVHKVVTNDNGGIKKATDFSFSVNGATAVGFTQDGANVLLGKNTLTPVNAGTYTVTEPAVTGYTSDASDCASVVVTNGGTGECTIYNNDQAGTLIVHKVVTNDNGGIKKATDFSFSVNGATAVGFTQDGANVLLGKNTLTPVNAGTYTVTEPAVTGYTSDASDCASVVVTNGGTGECTIYNNDQAGTLIVHKVVTNDNGGIKKATDFSFSVNGATAVGFTQDGANVLLGKNTLTPVNAGTYTVTEPAVTGYTSDASDCASVVVTNGGTGECTIFNNDTKASPTGSTTQRWVLRDTLNISGLRTGAPDAATSVTFKLYSNATCTTQVGSNETGTLTGSTATTVNGVAVSSPGTYYWTVAYPGDSYNNAFTTACGSETTTISRTE
ncbi:hypothetical protein LJR027_001623 [Terrabacter sp. LjRoot27]|uniref:hypothetical protein n=1 Tax=Terrabacter sp. LjRoot27 TaxID=3342306 RepID=UPI003ECD31DD